MHCWWKDKNCPRMPDRRSRRLFFHAHTLLHQDVRQTFQQAILGGTSRRGDAPMPDPFRRLQADREPLNRDDIMKNLGKMAIRRMARRGGVKRISAKIYPEASRRLCSRSPIPACLRNFHSRSIDGLGEPRELAG